MNIEDTHLACCTNPHEQKKTTEIMVFGFHTIPTALPQIDMTE